MIEQLDADSALANESALIALLRDSVDNGASVGFLPPLSTSEAVEYWRSVAEAVRDGTRVLWVARTAAGSRAGYRRIEERPGLAGALPSAGGLGGPSRPPMSLIGTAQLDLATRPNALHRAEVMKVMVAMTARRRGIGRALMLAIQEHARKLGRTTLVLDTRQGDPSERLYLAVGYRFAGTIPRYARSADGSLDPSAFYYRLLD